MKGTLDPPDTARRPALDAFAQAVDGIGDLLAGVAGLPGWTLTEDAALERLGELLAVRAAVDELTARVTATCWPVTCPASPERHRPKPG